MGAWLILQKMIGAWNRLRMRFFYLIRQLVREKAYVKKPSVPICVYQMGRVGSTSVKYSLEEYYKSHFLEIPVFHGHFLNEFETLEKRAKKDLESTTNFMKDLVNVELAFSKVLYKIKKNDKVKIISLVRDPIARNVSTFFYALDEFIPNWEERRNKENLSVDVLQQIFLNKQNYALTAFHWFEEQMEPVFGIDVYASPFPMEKGYKVYSSPKADLLLLRLESLDDCAQEAFDEFLGIPDFKLSKVNTGESRKAGELYRLFKEKPLPREYVEWSYSFKLALHFYTKEEIELFIKRWTL